MASGLLQHLGGVELVRPRDEPRQFGHLLADLLTVLPRRRFLHGFARAAAAGLVGVCAAHEHERSGTCIVWTETAGEGTGGSGSARRTRRS